MFGPRTSASSFRGVVARVNPDLTNRQLLTLFMRIVWRLLWLPADDR